jgi:hypothetical protein
MTPEFTKIVLIKIILYIWIENGSVLLYGPGIELALGSNSYVYDLYKMTVPDRLIQLMSFLRSKYN